MCFSASASFGASAVLGVIGIATVTKAKTSPQRLFGVIPLVFAAQQAAEGILWLSLHDSHHGGPGYTQTAFTYIFLVFAMMIWPVMIPLSIRLLEKDPRRKRIMNWLLGIGVLVFVGVGCILMIYPATVVPANHHLHYDLGFPVAIKKLIWLFDLLYFLATIVTPLLSSVRRMKWLGICFLLSYVYALIFYDGFVVSVWCFLAGLLSIIVYWILTGLRKQPSLFIF